MTPATLPPIRATKPYGNPGFEVRALRARLALLEAECERLRLAAPKKRVPRVKPLRDGAVEARKASSRRPKDRGPSLSQYVRAEGGIDYATEVRTGGWTGELDRLRKRGSGTTGLVRMDGKGRPLDAMRLSAIQAGYLPDDATLSDFVEAVEMDATGRGQTFSVETTDFGALVDSQFRRWADEQAARGTPVPFDPPF